MNREEMLLELKNAGVRAVPVMVTEGLGFQYDYITPAGAGSAYGCMGSWPFWKLGAISEDRWNAIVSALDNGEALPLSGTGLDRLKMGIHSAENTLENVFFAGLRGLEYENGPLYCLFDDNVWFEAETVPRFSFRKEPLLAAFADEYCQEPVPWADMDDDEVAALYARLSGDLKEMTARGGEEEE